MLAIKPTLAVRPSAVRPRVGRSSVVVRSTGKPQVDMASQVEQAVHDAEEACAKGTSKDCAVAWDTVEELSAAASKKKAAAKADPISNDPLEKYCQDAPDADECRVYED